MNELELPEYKRMTPELRERFTRLKQRPVILEAVDVSKRFVCADGGQQEVLRDVSFRLHHRELLSVIGPSGCGKSTLIRIAAGLTANSGGKFLLDGREVSGTGPERGMVFQKYTLFPWLTVKKNVMFGLEASGKSATDAEMQALQWLDIVGLEQYADAYPAQLSGGMQQRVAIARGLAPRPRVLLMDEPFGALDAQTRGLMQEYLLEVLRNIDISIIFVTHDLDEAVYLADRILALKANPGEVHEVIEVPLERPRRPEKFHAAPFRAVRAHIEELIRPKAERPEKSDARVIRMAVADNEYERNLP